MDCDCTESCAMADQFTPATRELMVFTKSAKRYFDLDSVRSTEEVVGRPAIRPANPNPKHQAMRDEGIVTHGVSISLADATYNKAGGAPPLDWWKIDPDIPYTPQHEGEQMPATFYVGDAIEVMSKLPENSVDLILTSPPFLALRSYLPADHPDKPLEGGSQATPGEYVDWLLDVVEACNRVLAPHGSLCIELGDTYAGAGAAESDGSARRERITDYGDGITKRWEDGATGYHSVPTKGTGWPLAKSLSLIPESFRFAMVYGFNPHTGRTTEPWRLRNVIRWVRPNPPVGALGDKFRPATSELMVFCKSAKRYFDLDAVREPFAEATRQRERSAAPASIGGRQEDGGHRNNEPPMRIQQKMTHSGAPPLDWWNIPILDGEEPAKGGPKTKDRSAENWTHPIHDPRDDRTIKEPSGQNPAGAPPLDWWNIPLLEGEEETRLRKPCIHGRYDPHTFAIGNPTLVTSYEDCDGGEFLVVGDAWNIPLLEGEEETRYGKKEAPPKVNRDKVMYTSPDRNDGQPGQERYSGAHPNGAPPLDWWEIPPGGFSGAHYAVFPPELCVKPVKAMCPEKVCRVCGEPSRRIVEASAEYQTAKDGSRGQWLGGEGNNFRETGGLGHVKGLRTTAEYETTGFSDCGHDDWRPGMVLDCFGGSGTTALVATGHGRDCILIDLDERNFDLALERVGPFILTRGES